MPSVGMVVVVVGTTEVVVVVVVVVVVGVAVVVGAIVDVVVELGAAATVVVTTASSAGMATTPSASIAARVSASSWGKNDAMPSWPVPSTKVISNAEVSSTRAGTGTTYRARSSASARVPVSYTHLRAHET